MGRQFTFQLVNTDRRFPDLVSWCCLIRTFELLIAIHGMVVTKFCRAWQKDPHTDKLVKDEPFLAYVLNPLHQATQWLDTADQMLIRYGQVLVNKNGGIVPPGADVVEEIICDRCIWPETEKENQTNKNRKVKISRWPMGTHYYLERRDSLPVKFDSLKDALESALISTSRENIGIAEQSYPAKPEEE